MNNVLSCGEYANLRTLCHSVKDGEHTALEHAALLLSKITPSDATLVPIPSHSGRATYTLELSRLVSKIVGCKVNDCLVGDNRERLYDLKKKGISTQISFTLRRNVSGNVYLVDNCVDTRQTYEAAMSAIGVVPIIVIAKTIKTK